VLLKVSFLVSLRIIFDILFMIKSTSPNVVHCILHTLYHDLSNNIDWNHNFIRSISYSSIVYFFHWNFQFIQIFVNQTRKFRNESNRYIKIQLTLKLEYQRQILLVEDFEEDLHEVESSLINNNSNLKFIYWSTRHEKNLSLVSDKYFYKPIKNTYLTTSVIRYFFKTIC